MLRSPACQYLLLDAPLGLKTAVDPGLEKSYLLVRPRPVAAFAGWRGHHRSSLPLKASDNIVGIGFHVIVVGQIAKPPHVTDVFVGKQRFDIRRKSHDRTWLVGLVLHATSPYWISMLHLKVAGGK
jgi:hypothetical protein